ncbi:hypothetical protein [Isoptericola sp. NPDC056134]|uniref:hypothetical protein n=1 Tax=Isoptericola sp. NPDC056134 TaxID=3345723 RepID=UPI0035E885F9
MSESHHSHSRGGWRAPAHRPPREHAEIARNGTQEERWQLAGQQDIGGETVRLLIEAGPRDVRESLALNYALTSDQLERLIEVDPSIESLVAANRNARPEVKARANLTVHTHDSIDQYLNDVGATERERSAMLAMYSGALKGDAATAEMTLGTAWNSVQNR